MFGRAPSPTLMDSLSAAVQAGFWVSLVLAAAEWLGNTAPGEPVRLLEESFRHLFLVGPMVFVAFLISDQLVGLGAFDAASLALRVVAKSSLATLLWHLEYLLIEYGPAAGHSYSVAQGLPWHAALLRSLRASGPLSACLALATFVLVERGRACVPNAPTRRRGERGDPGCRRDRRRAGSGRAR